MILERLQNLLHMSHNSKGVFFSILPMTMLRQHFWTSLINIAMSFSNNCALSLCVNSVTFPGNNLPFAYMLTHFSDTMMLLQSQVSVTARFGGIVIYQSRNIFYYSQMKVLYYELKYFTV